MDIILENMPITVEENLRNQVPKDIINIIDTYLVGTDTKNLNDHLKCPDRTCCNKCEKKL